MRDTGTDRETSKETRLTGDKAGGHVDGETRPSKQLRQADRLKKTV